MEYRTLANGLKMPLLGFGVFQVDDLKQCEQAIKDAIKVGYRLLDTAMTYHNESAVGKAVRESGVPRSEFFVTTKAWISDMGEERTQAAFNQSLAELGLDYIDLYLLHMPLGDYYGAWRALEQLYREGKVKAIGVSNFTAAQLIDLKYNCEIVPMVNQIEHHPHYQRVPEVELMQEMGIQVEAWAPFAEGMHGMFTEPVLERIAAKHLKTVAQVILRWNLEAGIVVIPKSVRPERMAENFAVFDFALDDEDKKLIATLDKHKASMLDLSLPSEVHRLYSYLENPVVTSLS